MIPDIISDRLTNDFPPPETSDFQPKTIIGKIGAEREMTAGRYALVVLSRFEQGANVDFMAVVDDDGVGHVGLVGDGGLAESLLGFHCRRRCCLVVVGGIC